MNEQLIFSVSENEFMNENFSDDGNAHKKFVVISDTSYTSGVSSTDHISIGGIKSLYDGSGTTKGLGEVVNNRLISSILIYYYDSVLGNRELAIHSSPTLFEDLESFITSLENSDKYERVIIVFMGSGLNMRYNGDIKKSIFVRYKTSFPTSVFDRDDLFPKNSDGSLSKINISYILGINVKSKTYMFDSVKWNKRVVIDSKDENQTLTRVNMSNQYYFPYSKDEVFDGRIDGMVSNDKFVLEYIGAFGLSTGTQTDDLTIYEDENAPNLIFEMGSDFKYYKNIKELPNNI